MTDFRLFKDISLGNAVFLQMTSKPSEDDPVKNNLGRNALIGVAWVLKERSL
jgi:hypothetical protein